MVVSISKLILVISILSMVMRKRTEKSDKKEKHPQSAQKPEKTATVASAQTKRASTYGTYVENMKKREPVAAQPRPAEKKPKVTRSVEPVKTVEPVKPAKSVKPVSTVVEAAEQEEDLMKAVYDLMVMGPDFEIDLERDFVAEGEKITSFL